MHPRYASEQTAVVPEERRLITVLFADFVGSTASARGRDSEVVRRAYAETYARLRLILEGHGGTVEKFIGDAVMAVFGIPTAHEDDAERALRAAFAVRDEIHQIALNGPLKFDVRIGVSSGEAVIDMGRAEQFLATGPVVAVAARLEAKAKPGEILVTPLTRQLAGSAVAYGPARQVAAKGFGRLSAIPARALTMDVPIVRDLSRLNSPLIGRNAELAALLAAHERCTEERRPRVVVVTGEAGIGKSRLVREAVARLACDVRQGRCLPYGDAITFYPLQQVLREEARIEPGDSLADARAKLVATIRDVCGDADADLVASRLGVIAGLAGTEAMGDVARNDVADELRWAVRQYFAARATRAPLALVFEDVHWAEHALLEALYELIYAAGPLLIVLIARPEFLDRSPEFRALQRGNLVSLRPLEASESRQLIGELLAIDGLPERLRADVVASSGGNPLFVEEFVRLLLDAGHVRRRGRRWVAVDPVVDLKVPPTLHGLIAARLDQLSSDVRALVLRAAVAGRVVSVEGLEALGDAREAALQAAVAREVLALTNERSIGGGSSFRFVHVLVRDVAYGMLAKAERLTLHDRFGRWSEQTLGERRDEGAEIVAYHAEQAALLALDLEQARSDLCERGLDQLLRAAAVARAREDVTAAARLYERASALADASSAQPARRLECRAWRTITSRVGRGGAKVEDLDALIEEAERLGPSSILARLLLERAGHYAEVDLCEASVSRALAIATAVGDVQLIAEALHAGFLAPTRRGDLAEAERRLHLAAQHARTHGLAADLNWALRVLANHAVERGALTEALVHLHEMATVAGGGGSRSGEMNRYRMIQWIEETRRDFAAADLASAKLVAIAREVAVPAEIAYSLWGEGELRFREGQPDRAVAVFNEAAEIAREHELRILPRVQSSRALAHAALGNVSAATQDARAVLDSQRTATFAVADPINRANATAALALLAAQAGRDAEADRLFIDAIAIIDRSGFGAFKVAIREPYVPFLMQRARWQSADKVLEFMRAYYHDPLVAHVAAEIDGLRVACRAKVAQGTS